MSAQGGVGFPSLSHFSKVFRQPMKASSQALGDEEGGRTFLYQVGLLLLC